MSLGAACRRAGDDLLYLSIGLITSAVAMTVWIAGVAVSASLAVFVVGFPAIIVSAVAFRWAADLDRRNAARVLGAPVPGRYRPHGGPGLLTRVRATLGDPQTWRDLAWLVAHSVVGLVFGVVGLSVAATVLGLAVAPAWYWALPAGIELGIWTADTLEEAFLLVPLALPLAAVCAGLLRIMALAEARMAAGLLGPPPPRPAAVPASAPMGSVDVTAALAAHVGVAALAGLVCTLIWALTGDAFFWPAWVWLALALTVSLHLFAVRLAQAGGDPFAALRARAEVCAAMAVLCVGVWALAGGGYFWPVWPALGLGAALAARTLVAYRHRLPGVREQRLVERVDELTRTRRGALDVQAAELRRIERDLHDGAQARLVALSMQLGRAEERLAGDPEAAALVRQARGEAGAAIAELRDLARGIAPPVLADRGLAAAADALGRRSAIPVAVAADVPRRPPPVIETAAYFVVAEALTNAAKHAPGASARVTVALDGDRLVAEVADDGPGGADPAGGGLTGLRHRVQALDGSLRVTSPAGGGTTIRAELPCES